MALLALRAPDWVPQVQAAALARLRQAPVELWLHALPLVEQLVRERFRTDELDALTETRLSNGALLAATRSPEPRARRAGWRRLVARGGHYVDDVVHRAADDPDVAVRAIAAELLRALDTPRRRALAERLVGDCIRPARPVAIGQLSRRLGRWR